MTRGHCVPRVIHRQTMSARRNNTTIKIRIVCGHVLEFVCPVTGELLELVRIRGS